MNLNDELGDLVFLECFSQGRGKHSVWRVLCKRCNKECRISSGHISKLKNKCCSKCSRFSTRKSVYVSGHMFQHFLIKKK